MIRCCILWAMLASWAATLVEPASAEEAWLEWIGDVPGGGHNSWIADLSRDGSVGVGAGQYSGLLNAAFVWSRETGIVLLDPNFVYLQSQAFAVSDDGTAVAGLLTLRQPQHVLAFRWTPEEGIRVLGDLPGGARQSFGMGISGDGERVVGYSASDRADDVESFLWTPALGMVGLGAQTGGRYFFSAAFDISADGRVVVGVTDGPRGNEPYRWTAETGFQTLAPEAGPWFGTAYGVSRDGSVVVGKILTGGETSAEAFRWSEQDGFEYLGVLPGTVISIATDVSDDGRVVVGWCEPGFVPFVWTPETGMRNLFQIATDDLGFELRPSQIGTVDAVSGDGRTVAGQGYAPNGQLEGFVLHLGDGVGCVGDVNRDGSVDLADLSRVLANFGTPGGALPEDGDLDQDGDVDADDLQRMLGRFGARCP